MASEKLREVAALLREKSAEYDKKRMEKCAKVLIAAKGLELLRRKVRPNG